MSTLRLERDADEHTSVKLTSGMFKKHYYRHGGIWREIEVGFDELFLAERFDGSNGMHYAGKTECDDGFRINVDPEPFCMRKIDLS